MDWREAVGLRIPFQRCCLIVLLALAPSLASAGKPTWARKATGFPGDCQSGCREVRVAAPDKTTAVEVLYQDSQPYLRVTARDQPAREIHDLGTGPWNDLEWAPDSKAFFVSSGEAITSPASVAVYLLDDPQLRALDVSQPAVADMVKSFPPCKALYLDQTSCRNLEKNPDYNITAIDWADDSSAMVLKVQVPCTSNFGGIMCQTMGYEVGVPSGNIVKRMTAAELKAAWQKQMAQRLQIPEPPQYQ